MEFVEQPLTYEEARFAVEKFEHTHKILSAVLFSGKMEPNFDIGSDTLFEWKSYYDFVREVDSRLAAELNNQGCDWIGKVAYAANAGREKNPRTAEERRQAEWCIAA